MDRFWIFLCQGDGILFEFFGNLSKCNFSNAEIFGQKIVNKIVSKCSFFSYFCSSKERMVKKLRFKRFPKERRKKESFFPRLV
jgi:hypothetical protein